MLCEKQSNTSQVLNKNKSITHPEHQYFEKKLGQVFFIEQAATQCSFISWFASVHSKIFNKKLESPKDRMAWITLMSASSVLLSIGTSFLQSNTCFLWWMERTSQYNDWKCELYVPVQNLGYFASNANKCFIQVTTATQLKKRHSDSLDSLLSDPFCAGEMPSVSRWHHCIEVIYRRIAVVTWQTIRSNKLDILGCF